MSEDIFDIELLARELHKWPENYDDHISVAGVIHGWSWDGVEFTIDGFTRDQWQAERARLQSKPSWDDAPEWAQALGQNAIGTWWWLPYYNPRDRNHEEWTLNKTKSFECDIAGRGDVLGDWRDTLERRPEYSLYEVTTSNGDKYMPTDAPEPKKEWRGPEDGLPPIGSIVAIAESGEYLKIRYPAGAEVKIYAQFTDVRGVELAAFVDDYGQVGGIATAKCFRPIRTEEDKAVEEWCALIDDAISKYNINIDCSAAIKATIVESYRAGYRKQGSSE